MNDDFLEDLILAAKAMDAPPKEPSEKAKELFEAALARRQPFKVVSDKQMKVIILQILSKGRFDGGEIVEKLNESKVRLATQGDGVIYALLSEMEEADFISGAFDAAMVRKTYERAARGKELLKKNAASVQGINEPVAALFAT